MKTWRAWECELRSRFQMKKHGRWLGGVGILVVACGATKLTKVGDLNDGQGGSGAQAGNDDAGDRPSAGSKNTAEAGTAAVPNGTGGNGGVPDPITPEGGTGGTAIVPDPPIGGIGGIDGAGGDTYDPPDPVGTVFEEASSKVTAVAADDTTLYWVEYGTTDSLGNYLNNGRLVARDFDSTEARVLSSELPGAVGLALTSDHAYVSVDQYYDGGPRNALMRVALTGGTPQAVLVRTTDHWDGYFLCPECFAHDDDTGYFSYDDKIYRITPTASKAELVADIPGSALSSGDENLYVQGDGIWTISYATGTANQLTTVGRAHIQVSGEYLYGLDYYKDSLYLSRMPLAGGNWVRLPPKRPAQYSWSLQALDGLFFQDLHAGATWQVIQGNLAEPSGAAVALELPSENTGRIWVGTHAGIFWNDGKRVLQVPLVVE
jgi:hypothetical protein